MPNCGNIEICHTEDCSGFDEVQSLLPKGRLWDITRNAQSSRLFRALGDIKTQLNRLICAEWDEIDPCKSNRLLPYHSEVYGLPKCVDQTAENLCKWITLITDETCPIGSVGFYQNAIDFVAPDKGISLSINTPENGKISWQSSSNLSCENVFVITAPSDVFRYETVGVDSCDNRSPKRCSVPQDGFCPERYYHIPEIECLRKSVFPFGVSLGYRTSGNTKGSADIVGVSSDQLVENKWN